MPSDTSINTAFESRRWGGMGRGDGLRLFAPNALFLPFDVHVWRQHSMSQIGLAEAALLARTRRRDLHQWQSSRPFNWTLGAHHWVRPR